MSCRLVPTVVLQLRLNDLPVPVWRRGGTKTVARLVAAQASGGDVAAAVGAALASCGQVLGRASQAHRAGS